jgi:dissimilatory sulfite reductase (desulfoviridin) alpha/beta subunit
MRTIIAGSRDIDDMKLLESAIAESKMDITIVVCGEARGVDWLGKEWAISRNIPVHSFPANWSLHGKSAGFIRNTEMAENADALIAVWDGESRGTKMMIDIAKKKGLKVFVKNILKEEDSKNEYKTTNS